MDVAGGEGVVEGGLGRQRWQVIGAANLANRVVVRQRAICRLPKEGEELHLPLLRQVLRQVFADPEREVPS